jgi:hypothetical protein
MLKKPKIMLESCPYTVLFIQTSLDYGLGREAPKGVSAFVVFSDQMYDAKGRFHKQLHFHAPASTVYGIVANLKTVSNVLPQQYPV